MLIVKLCKQCAKSVFLPEMGIIEIEPGCCDGRAIHILSLALIAFNEILIGNLFTFFFFCPFWPYCLQELPIIAKFFLLFHTFPLKETTDYRH